MTLVGQTIQVTVRDDDDELPVGIQGQITGYHAGVYMIVWEDGSDSQWALEDIMERTLITIIWTS